MKLKNDKKCSRCGRVLNVDDFYTSNKAKNGKQGYCKECCKEYARGKRMAKEVTPNDRELKEIELLRIANKKWKKRFKQILNLYLNEGEIL